ncbi:Spo0E family sporulation regulatory protein-aspartic acid phosphatase [Pontibacillus sp. HMF3514]|uniref:Spo0E family sporulation regulatory protein-aspartic acid phosphatase n=1 Tax=Pontibacillus sp. HMF3514 TaxID=2692425 RepID=UPI00131FD982|nr:Spo0E family sporulation regulatory protein-aspartic acid phosphatase [Pontibacillus sp. HMF3514]QHE51623.1 Spo0E family sporulation regulatory protein-aspartic acid phosphatase [Pontibacillus sp. HMF3514]
MELKSLESEIKQLQMRLYDIGKEKQQYSSGEILKLSEELDKKIILYQKLQYSINN